LSVTKYLLERGILVPLLKQTGLLGHPNAGVRDVLHAMAGDLHESTVGSGGAEIGPVRSIAGVEVAGNEAQSERNATSAELVNDGALSVRYPPVLRRYAR
jgi:hypothetical protein